MRKGEDRNKAFVYLSGVHRECRVKKKPVLIWEAGSSVEVTLKTCEINMQTERA